MTNLARAREAARACRVAVGPDPDGLLGRLIDYLWTKYRVEPRPAPAERMDGSVAELRGRVVFYDESLDADPQRLLVVLAHELGHLALHPRVRRRSGPPDPVLAASYLAGERGVALARYNPRTREEAEATAFATEFVCPSDAAFALWASSPAATSSSVAREFGVDRAVSRAQLAEGLVIWLRRGREPIPSGRTFAPNRSQRAAIDHRDGPALVDAGPGTGKTATLVARAAALVSEGVPPSAILVLTFSNEAADELRVRLDAVLTGDDALDVVVSTIHGLGREFLHLHGGHLGVPPDAVVLDDYAQVDLVNEAFGRVPPSPIFDPRAPRQSASEAARHVNRIKQTAGSDGGIWSPASLRADLESAPDATPAQFAFLDLLGAYEALKQERGALDFADLVALPTQILRERADIRAAYAKKYRHILVDEFQDVSETCALFLRELASAASPWVVGDARQAIYRFLGASPENVTQFDRLFGSPTRYALSENYRSCAEIVEVANQLATSGPGPANSKTPVWTASGTQGDGGEVRTAVAESDAAEIEGAVTHALKRIEEGTAPHEIAVLARRNLDVERVVAALAASGVRANAAGSLSPEGAAGDLAAVLTLPDQPRSSIPRLTYALHGEGPGTLDRAVSALFEALEPEGTFDPSAFDGDTPDVVFDVVRTAERLRAEAHSADGFDALVSFLFDGGAYLRNILSAAKADDPDTSSPATHRLNEVIASLARAAAYRVVQGGQTPEDSRLQLAAQLRSTPTAADRVRFAEHFRRALAESTPTAVAPRPTEGAVQVMTVHASKGLEFTHVILIGQSAPVRTSGFPWLPPAFGDAVVQEESEQADALLFVGATRAKRSLVVSYATSASGAARSRRRSPSPLFEAWLASATPEVWPAPPPDPAVHRVTLAWMDPLPDRVLSTRSLDASTCALRTATEDVLRLRFPTGSRPMYPAFYAAVRLGIARVLDAAWDSDQPVPPDQAQEIYRTAWNETAIAPHPQENVYRELAARYIDGFARAYTPQAGRHEPLPVSLSVAPLAHPVRLGLVRAYRRPDGVPVALLFRPESYKRALGADGRLKWSGLSAPKRLSFALLRDRYPDLLPLVYSGDDGAIHAFAWSRRAGSADAQVENASQRAVELTSGTVDYKVSAWACDRCPVRVGCLHHLRSRGRDFFQ